MLTFLLSVAVFGACIFLGVMGLAWLIASALSDWTERKWITNKYGQSLIASFGMA